MIRLTLTKTSRGDLEMHRAGCADLKVRARHQGSEEETHYEGETLLGALRVVDEDWADAFGEDAYTDQAVENGCWTVSASEKAACFVAMLRAERVEFDPRTGRPTIAPRTIGGKPYEQVVSEARAAKRAGLRGAPKTSAPRPRVAVAATKTCTTPGCAALRIRDTALKCVVHEVEWRAAAKVRREARLAGQA